MDGVYLLDKVFPWRRLWYRGRYIVYLLLQWNFSIFSRGGLWYWKYCSVFHLLFHGEDGEFWIPFHAGNCCGRYRTYLCKFFANLLRNCDSIRCVSFASKVNGIGYLSSDQDCDLMDSVSKWNIQKGEILDLNHAKFTADVRLCKRIVNSNSEQE